jgi:hypothetical protein
MPIPVSTRIHEWLADRVSWIQYPQIKPLGQQRRRSLFKHQMHWTTRLAIGTISLLVVAFAGLVLLVALIVLKGVLFG